jgi:TolA-binding protein
VVTWLRTGVLAGVLAVFAAVVAGPANAQQGDPGTDPVAAAVTRADQSANSYIDALTRAQQIDAEIAQLEQNIAGFEQRVAELRDLTRGRAVEAYKRSSTPLVVQVGVGAAVMDDTRRTVLLDTLNTRDVTVASKLRDARDRLDVRRQELKVAQQQQAEIVNRLREREQRLNSDLAAAQAQRRAARGQPADAAITPVANYVPRPGEHPQHNDPWMVCTRRIESGGNYRAYNASGPYYGAYQFTQSTWNSTANHAGRGELVGMDPRDASEYDQDDMAWTLYQWKGKGPWGGRC